MGAMFPNLSFSIGNGSRGNRGTANRGLGFEKDIFDILVKINAGDEVTGHLANELRKITDLFGDEDWEIIHEGALNKSRSPIWNGNRLMVNNGLKSIGPVVTDITLKSKSRTEYLSLKVDKSGRTNYANLGSKKFFPDTMFKDNAPVLNSAIPVLKWFGINQYDKFVDVFKLTNAEEILETSNVPAGWQDFIQESIGWGYWKVTQNSVKYFDENEVKSLSKCSKLKVRYPKSPIKTVYVHLDTNPSIQIEIRNVHGGILPEMILIYQKK